MARHELATTCIWCKEPFVPGDKLRQKVFDHDHLTGKYRGPACQGCNNKLRQNRETLVVVFHNFRGYDSHALCLQGLSNKPQWELRPIAQNPEKYLALSAYLYFEESNKKRNNYFSIKFIDSCQLMNSSLATIASNLVKGNDYSLLKHATAMRTVFPRVSEADLTAKGIFPYTYVDSWERLEERGLPTKADFYDSLEDRVCISDEEYARARMMFEGFNCTTLFDYQLRYLELDFRLLADVFEHFRVLVKREDGMDAAHFMTVSQLSYASVLKW